MTEYSKKEEYMASQVSIMDYLQSRGYTCKLVGSGQEYKFKDIGNSFYVNAQKNCFNWYSHSVGGGPIQCLQEVFGLDRNSAIRELIGEPSQDRYISKYKTAEKTSEPDEKSTEFIPPDKAEHYKNAYGYLIKERGLDKNLINDFVKQGVLYQTTSTYTDKESGKVYNNHNIVFLHIDENGEPCGASLQGTRSDKRFKQNMAGTVNDFGYVYNKGADPKTVYLFEAPIDMMSFVQLHPEIENAKFVAMEGLKPTIAEHYINSGYMVISCVDNDTAGKSFNNRILNDLMQKAFGGQSVKLTIDDRKPPIEYLEAENNGNKITLFLSEDDYKDFKEINGSTSGRCFIWKNESNYQLNTELAEYGVKDFNDLLKKSISAPEKELNEAVEWSHDVIEACDEHAQQREAEQERGQAK